jgi:hypothetical protein
LQRPLPFPLLQAVEKHGGGGAGLDGTEEILDLSPDARELAFEVGDDIALRFQRAPHALRGTLKHDTPSRWCEYCTLDLFQDPAIDAGDGLEQIVRADGRAAIAVAGTAVAELALSATCDYKGAAAEPAEGSS